MSNSKYSKQARRRNGMTVIKAFRYFNRPVSLKDLAKYIADTNNLKPEEIMRAIEFIIETGVAIGFLVKHDAQYAVSPDLQASESGPAPQHAIEENPQSRIVNTSMRPTKQTKRRIVYDSDDSDEDYDPSPPKKTKRSKK